MKKANAEIAEKTEQLDLLKEQLKEFSFSNIDLDLFEEMAKISQNLIHDSTVSKIIENTEEKAIEVISSFL